MSSREKDNIALSDEHNSRGIELADRGWLDEAINEFRFGISKTFMHVTGGHGAAAFLLGNLT